jgi:hypothetical protein
MRRRAEHRLSGPTGEDVVLNYEGPEGDWLVSVRGASDQPASSRSLYQALWNALGLSGEDGSEWADEAANTVVGVETPVGRRFPCPCCDLLTLDDRPPGTFEICPVCGWEDDGLQFVDMEREGGANRISLDQARENYREFGVSHTLYRGRPLEPYEVPPAGPEG